MYKKIAFISLVLILVIVNFSIYKKEQHIKNGKIIFLKLAPVDPRSLMQGDYMALRFDIEQKIQKNIPINKSIDGFIVVSVDKNNIAKYLRIYNNKILNKNEFIIKFRIRNRKIKFATNAFFFQEGDAKKYEKSKYGMFRINNKGDLLLTNMYNEELEKI